MYFELWMVSEWIYEEFLKIFVFLNVLRNFILLIELEVLQDELLEFIQKISNFDFLGI